MQRSPEVEPWKILARDGPIIATAIHAGHRVRSSLAPFMKLSAPERLREEDPFTEEFASERDTLLCVNTSRFEVDLNRARDAAVYSGPESAWGLDVWQQTLPGSERRASLALYDSFYASLFDLVRARLDVHPRVVVLDLHSYNHMRDGPDQPPAPAGSNPVVNVGTASADRDAWGGVIDRFVQDLGAQTFEGAPLDARENVKFGGGELSRQVAREFGPAVLVLSIEFKKVFMDEWTGEKNAARVHQLRDALEACVAPIRETCRARSKD